MIDTPAQISAFLDTACDPVDWIEIRPLPIAESTWHRAADHAEIIAACTAASQRGQNVYIGVNPRLDHGRRGNAGVSHAWCLFVDFDEKHLKSRTLPEQIEEVKQRIAAACLPQPSMIVASGHGLHVYWRLSAPLSDLNLWDEAMDALITTLGSDTGAKGRDRIMRLPGLMNWKAPAAMAELVECNPAIQYDFADIASAIWHGNTPDPAIVARVATALSRHAGRAWNGGRASIIDSFNDTIPVAEVLAAGGYDICGSHFRRPGKSDRGFSGLIRPNKRGRLCSAHWSSNDPLNDCRFGGGVCAIHDSFDVFSLLEHGGDVTAAVKAAATLLNIQLPKQKPDSAILREISNSERADEFASLFFTHPKNNISRARMKEILAVFTSNPRQIERLMDLAAKEGMAKSA